MAMLANTDLERINETTRVPLIEGHGDEGGANKTSWWKKVLDVEEAKKRVLFSLPMIFTNLFYYLITLVSVMFAGHLGKLELAGATLANSRAIVTERRARRRRNLEDRGCMRVIFVCSSLLCLSVTGFAFMVGLSGALETLCGQRVICIWIPAKNLEISSGTICCPAIGLLVRPPCYSFRHCLWFGTLDSSWLQGSSTCGFNFPWEGFSLESFHYVLTDLKLALPSALMVCLEEWVFEILVLMGGLMPNSEEITSLMAMCVNTEAIAYMIIYGLSAAASTRVSNDLGAGNPDKAKKAMAVTLKLSMLLAFVLVLTLVVGHNIRVGFFSDSRIIAEQFASMVPLLVISIIVDSVQSVLSGVARGCGWQHLTVYVNIVTFYLIGMTISSLLGFKFKLHAKGLWIGLTCGLSCQAATVLYITQSTKWTVLDLSDIAEREKPVLV
ncbi:unnamed protein product [Prunus armeniaca]